MLPFRIEVLDIVIIVAVALLIFGPRQLPQIARSVSRAINEFRHGAKEMAEGFREEVTMTRPPNSTAPPATPPLVAAQFCTNCGAGNTRESQFCVHCGAPLASVPNDSGNPSPPTD